MHTAFWLSCWERYWLREIFNPWQPIFAMLLCLPPLGRGILRCIKLFIDQWGRISLSWLLHPNPSLGTCVYTFGSMKLRSHYSSGSFQHWIVPPTWKCQLPLLKELFKHVGESGGKGRSNYVRTSQWKWLKVCSRLGLSWGVWTIKKVDKPITMQTSNVNILGQLREGHTFF